MSATLLFTQKQRLLRGVYPERPSTSALRAYAQDERKRRARNDTGLNLMTLLYQRGGVCFLPLLLFFAVFLLPGAGFAQTSTLTVADNEPVDIAPGEPGPGDNMVVVVRRNGKFVESLSFATGQPGEIVTHRLNRDGTLDPVGRTPAGREPRQIAPARNGDYAVVVNSIDNQLGVFSIGDDGLPREISRTSSGGLNPFDVAVAYNDIVVVTNRDSDQINTFSIDRRGRLTPVDVAIPGVDPHVVSVSSRGFVGVANQTERSVSIYHINRRGELNPLGPAIPTDGMTPQAATWHGRWLYVALDKPFPEEDVIRTYHVNRRGQVAQFGDIAAGVFLTDIEANEDGLFAVTANRNNPADPTDDRDEARVYRINKDGSLSQDASVQTDNFPPSFKQISTSPARGPNDRHVIVTEFQGGWLCSLIYDRRRTPR